MSAIRAAQNNNPFPGLRPFREEEEYLFFGRESQVDAMVDKLAITRFLAVVGTSGSGKSSLVNCGLRPTLHGGLMASAGTAWRMAQFRPGSDPLRAMADALAQNGVLFRDHRAGYAALTDIVDTTLRMSKLGLVDIVKQARLDEGVNLLLVVDQFEELFRYRQLGAGHKQGSSGVIEQATAFVNLLLEAAAQTACPVYVVLTMRSDFLGDCAQFTGLAEAINAGQFLVPRMTRDERRAAIKGPVGVGGAEISPVLLTRLVNDVGDNPDQLSILQHALNRTWANWENECGGTGPLELKHYEDIGGMTKALDQHAKKAFKELHSERQQRICEKVFKALTDKASDPRGIRRPTPMNTLCALADATVEEITEVIGVFRKPSRSFLMPPAGEALVAETIIDISHESLMRVWKGLDNWANEEAESARIYRRLAEDAVLEATGEVGLRRDPELQQALDWRAREQPNETWARRYHPEFGAAMDFLSRSSAARAAEQAEREQQHQRELEAEREQQHQREQQRQRELEIEREKAEIQARNFRWMSIGAVVCLALALGAGLAYREAVLAIEEALLAKEEAVLAKEEAVLAKEEARKLEDKARRSEVKALWQAGIIARDYAHLPVLAAHNFLRAAETASESNYTRHSYILAAHFATAGLVRSFPHDARVKGAKVTITKPRVLSWSKDGALKLWDVNKVEPLREWKHDRSVRNAVFNDDESRVLSWSEDGALKLWDVDKVEPLREWTHDVVVSGAVFNDNESRVLSWSRDGVLKLWDVNKTEPLLTWKHGKAIRGAVFDGDESRVLSWSSDGALKLWDVTKTEPLKAWKHDQYVRGAMFNGDESRVLSWSRDGALKLWDIKTVKLPGAKQIKPYRQWKHNKAILGAVFSSDESRVLSWSVDGALKLWDVTGTELLNEWKHDGMLTAEMITLDGSQIVSWGEKTGTKMWHIGKIEPHQEWKGSLHKPSDTFLLKLNNHGVTQELTLSEGGVLRLWRENKTTLRREWEHDKAVRGAVFNDEESRVLSWSSDGALKLWDVNKAEPHKAWKHDRSVRGAVFNADESRVLSWSSDGALKLWDVNTDEPPLTWKHDKAILGAVFNGAESHVLSWSSDGALKLWDIKTVKLPDEKQIKPYREWKHNKAILGAVFNSNESRVLSWSSDGALKLWNVTKAEPHKSWKHDKIILGAVFNGDESRVLSWSIDGALKLWDVNRVKLPDEEQIKPFREWKHDSSVRGAVFNGSETRVLSWSSDGALKLWDVNTVKLSDEEQIIPRREWKHDRSVRGAVFNDDESRVLSWSSDGALKLWDVNTLEPLLTWKHDKSVRGAVFNDDESRVLSWSSDGVLKLWDTAGVNNGASLSHKIKEFEYRSASKLDGRGQLIPLNTQKWKAKSKALMEN